MPKILDILPPGSVSFHDSSKRERKSVLDDFSFSKVFSIALTKVSSVLWFDKALSMSGTEISIMTFIPPLRSSPRLNSLSLHSLYV